MRARREVGPTKRPPRLGCGFKKKSRRPIAQEPSNRPSSLGNRGIARGCGEHVAHDVLLNAVGRLSAQSCNSALPRRRGRRATRRSRFSTGPPRPFDARAVGGANSRRTDPNVRAGPMAQVRRPGAARCPPSFSRGPPGALLEKGAGQGSSKRRQPRIPQRCEVATASGSLPRGPGVDGRAVLAVVDLPTYSTIFFPGSRNGPARPQREPRPHDYASRWQFGPAVESSAPEHAPVARPGLFLKRPSLARMNMPPMRNRGGPPATHKHDAGRTAQNLAAPPRHKAPASKARNAAACCRPRARTWSRKRRPAPFRAATGQHSPSAGRAARPELPPENPAPAAKHSQAVAPRVGLVHDPAPPPVPRHAASFRSATTSAERPEKNRESPTARVLLSCVPSPLTPPRACPAGNCPVRVPPPTFSGKRR